MSDVEQTQQARRRFLYGPASMRSVVCLMVTFFGGGGFVIHSYSGRADDAESAYARVEALHLEDQRNRADEQLERDRRDEDERLDKRVESIERRMDLFEGRPCK